MIEECFFLGGSVILCKSILNTIIINILNCTYNIYYFVNKNKYKNCYIISNIPFYNIMETHEEYQYLNVIKK